MRDQKYYIALDDFERRVVVNCLNEMLNKLIAGDKYTDAVHQTTPQDALHKSADKR